MIGQNQLKSLTGTQPITRKSFQCRVAQTEDRDAGFFGCVRMLGIAAISFGFAALR